ncbi:MAG: hypothetical protein QM674_15445 [Burkholderiaceae bacterium]
MLMKLARQYPGATQVGAPLKALGPAVVESAGAGVARGSVPGGDATNVVSNQTATLFQRAVSVDNLAVIEPIQEEVGEQTQAAFWAQASISTMSLSNWREQLDEEVLCRGWPPLQPDHDPPFGWEPAPSLMALP